MTDKEIKLMNKLNAKYKKEQREEQQYQERIQNEHLSKIWYEICTFYNIDTKEDQQRLFNHICSEQQKNYFNRTNY